MADKKQARALMRFLMRVAQTHRRATLSASHQYRRLWSLVPLLSLVWEGLGERGPVL